MKKFLVVLACLLLTGCFSPKIYDSNQVIHFENPSKFVIETRGYGTAKENKLTVNRSFSNLKVTLSKEGFEKKRIEIESHFTDHKWAKYSGWNDSRSESSIMLLPPSQTLFWTYSGIKEMIQDATIVGVFGYLIYGVSHDVWNIVSLSYLRAVLGNPWYEYGTDSSEYSWYEYYSIDLSREFLIPTPEFEKACHKKRDHFIGNHECLSCKTKEKVFATKDECDRCPHRSWEDGNCDLK